MAKRKKSLNDLEAQFQRIASLARELGARDKEIRGEISDADYNGTRGVVFDESTGNNAAKRANRVGNAIKQRWSNIENSEQYKKDTANAQKALQSRDIEKFATLNRDTYERKYSQAAQHGIYG